jgi:hypothetical protein
MSQSKGDGETVAGVGSVWGALGSKCYCFLKAIRSSRQPTARSFKEPIKFYGPSLERHLFSFTLCHRTCITWKQSLKRWMRGKWFGMVPRERAYKDRIADIGTSKCHRLWTEKKTTLFVNKWSRKRVNPGSHFDLFVLDIQSLEDRQ